MRQADAARADGRPADAVVPLRRVLRSHSDDPRAALAAFTLGRVLLDDLRKPGEAARAFRKARSLAPRGALAEDALAREVEAWARAGQAHTARERASLYLQQYPDGHRVHAMQQYAAE
jgi:transmembrane sensor